MTDSLEENLKTESNTVAGTERFERGQIVGAKYKVLSCLGSGGMGAVYRVQQVFLAKEFALKTLVSQRVSDVAVRRFQNEAKAATLLNHPNLVQVHDFGVLEETDQPYLVMDYVEGITLADYLKKYPTLTVEEAGPLFAQVCFGLAYAHDQGIVHRDIKPSNIMLVNGQRWGGEGSVRVVDFGIAKLLSSDDGEIQSLTRTGEVFGSPLYMSPEQCSGGAIDRCTDVYSLGCVIYEALTGAQPHIGQTALATMMLHQSEEPLSLKEASLGKDFPASIERIVSRMLAKNPRDRYQNLAVVAHDLARVFKEVSSNQFRLEKKEPARAPAVVSITPARLFLMLAATGIISAGIASTAVCFFMQSKAPSFSFARSGAEKNSSPVQSDAENIQERSSIDESTGKDFMKGMEPMMSVVFGEKNAVNRQYLQDVVRPEDERGGVIKFPRISAGTLWTAREVVLGRPLGQAVGTVHVPRHSDFALQILQPSADTARVLASYSPVTQAQISGMLFGQPEMEHKREIYSAGIVSVLNAVRNWPRLDSISIFMPIDESVLRALGDCKSLRHVILAGTRIEPETLARQPFIERLETLFTCSIPIDPTLHRLASYGKLRNLAVESGTFSAPVLSELSRCPDLKYFEILNYNKAGTNFVDDDVLEAIAQFGQLEDLTLANISLRPEQLSIFASSRSIKLIRLSQSCYSTQNMKRMNEEDPRVKFGNYP